ncbi:nicotinate-nucleotide--dimethylbenzimidazole phosphoribosyltransferase [Streptomyces sp. NBC_00525]|uniref:nicotinate-nucleotide--dimethylbenzimidazole phosphoribosyltransferase n=1 Tax=Streptomyces sp. NBC_00525 TaxID=2903660 RepID=UPI002E815FBB|nr:nicotinate-nucleotide--dimethylbenzimidazole phosphoribosyltransferase [Streptomyces sp. NBC_00525]WUC92775.1 nicotinate-nucleotide--dimethylbenzimidazole phosphoribosyltransferase [Streptomyces sp. NBC_00525]
MSDTGQIPAEGLPENGGTVEQPGVPAPDSYTPEDDDLLLMPSAQGAWGEPQPVQAPHHYTDNTGAHGAYPPADPAHAQGPVQLQEQPPAYAAQHAEPLPGSHESGSHESGGRDSGAVDVGAVRIPSPAPQPQAAARRPLHRGPASPEPTYGGTSGAGVVRSLADRGPAQTQTTARHAGPPPAEPEYFEPQPEPLPGPQLGAIPPQNAHAWTAPAPTPPPAAETVAPAAPVPPAAPEAVSEPAVVAEPVAQPAPVVEPVAAAATAVVEPVAPAEPSAAVVAPEAVAAVEPAPAVVAPEAVAVVEPAPVVETVAVAEEAPAAEAAQAAVVEPVPDADAAVVAEPTPAAEAAQVQAVTPATAPEAAPAATAEPVPAAEPAQAAEAVPVAEAAEAVEAVEAAEVVVTEEPAASADPAPTADVAETTPAPEATPAADAAQATDPVQATDLAQAADPAPVAEPAQAVEAQPAVTEEPAPVADPAQAAEATPVTEAAPAAEATQVADPAAEAAVPAAEPSEPSAAEEPAAAAEATPAAEPAPVAEAAQAAEAEPAVAGEPAQAPEAAATPAAPAAEAADVPPAAEPEPAVAEPVPAADADRAAEAAPAAETAQPEPAAQAAEPAAAEEPAEAAPAPEAPAPQAADPAPAAEAEPVPAAQAAPAAEAAPDPGRSIQPEAGPEVIETPDPGDETPPAPGYDDAEREAVLRVMRERRDIRNGFRSDPIPHEVLLRVLEAAHTAPSVGHSQPWDFVVIRSAETRRSMHELAQQQREAYAKSLPKARAKQFKELKIEAILDTPVNIVVTADPTRGGRHTLGRHTQPQMAPYSSALAVENLWLAARAEGLGVGWVSFFDEREMVRALGLPEHLEIVAYLCVGYVDEFPEDPELMQAGWSKRRPLSWVVHEETYGRRALPGEAPHDLLQETISNIRPLDAKALGEAWERQKRMTKPAGALGMLEIISAQLSGLSRMCPPPIPEPAAVAVFAGDHGVHAQGVTAWPQEVTGQMIANMLSGGAVCNAFASQVGAEVCVVDVGAVAELPATPGLLPRKVRAGTGDFTTGPALTREEVHAAIEVGIETARDLVAAGNKGLLTGEMGIANTTASAALICVYTGMDPAEVTGRGTGINDEMHARKIDVVRRALELHQPDPADPIGVLAAVGGLEHAAMAGFLLGGASLRTPVILDGVSAGAAALVARAIAPEALAACIAGHRSAEPGHVAALNKLGLRPLVDLDLRLGEGTGALLALPIVQSAARAMHEVATFDSAGVTEK